MVCPCTNLFLSNILAFLSLKLESGHLLPKEQESEHSHHSIESMRGTKVLHLGRERSSWLVDDQCSSPEERKIKLAGG